MKYKRITIPHFFKTKKFFVLVSIFILFFLFTPISLHQISSRVEDFINDRASLGVQAFEKQVGLKIKWEALNFNIFTMTVKLDDVQVIPLNTANFQKIQELHFLNGQQNIGKIYARPSLYSLLFKRQIFLSRLKIQDGDIYLKTIESFSKKPLKEAQNPNLPIKKIIIKDANINLSHKDYILKFSKLKSKILQKPGNRFQFDFFVKAFHMEKDLGFKGFQGLTEDLSKARGKEKGDQQEEYQLSFRGLAEKEKVSLRDIHLENESFKSQTEWLDVDFDLERLKKLGIKSSGTLPFFLVRQMMHFLGKEDVSLDSVLSYNLNIQYEDKKGYQGFFEVEGQDTVFKSHPLKRVFLKGRLQNHLLTLDKGFIESLHQGSLEIQKGELTLNKRPLPFHLSLLSNQLSSTFVSQMLFDSNEFIVQGRFSGAVNCEGSIDMEHLKCSADGKSDKWTLQDQILSFYGMNWKGDMEWKSPLLKWDLRGGKEDLSKATLSGQYSEKRNRVEASYTFFGNMGTDLRFQTPIPLKGDIEVQDGRLLVQNDKVKLTGSISSPLLKVQSYDLKNIAGRYKFENNQLDFINMKGEPDSSHYTANGRVDFDKNRLSFTFKSSFLDIENLLSALNWKVSPFQFKGTGTVSALIEFPWDSPEDRVFDIQGDLFNVYINKDFFQQVHFDFGMNNRQGFVRSLSFRKGPGFIDGTGSFELDHSINLNIVGQNLSLERLEVLNEVLPLNQSGDVNFNMKITGTLTDPEIQSDVSISNTFFYSYPVDESQIQLELNKKALSFSGHIIDEIQIEKFYYPFLQSSKMEVKGEFKDFDFIKMLFSKDRIEQTQDYFSKVTGSFSFSKMTRPGSVWTGKTGIDKFSISRSNQWIRNKNPFSVVFDQNKWSLTPVEFSGRDNKTLALEVRPGDKLFLSGESSLELFSVFFPFFHEFKGNAKAQILMDNNLKNFKPKGSLKLERALLSLEPLPDFEEVKAHFVISNNNIFINDFTSNAGGGQVQGGGSVFYDFKSAPRLNVNLEFSNAHLNIPEDFNTRGNGKIQIRGRKKPYLIKGKYKIDSGTITREFSSENSKKYDFSFLDQEEKNQISVFALNIDIQTKEPVVVNSSLIRSSVEGRARIYGPLDSLLIKGEFSLPKRAEESLIFFRGQEFEINSGSIFFKDSPPDNPYLNVKAQTLFKEQVIDPLESQQEIEKEYDIFLSLQGPSQNPRFSLESSPALNEKEIISLLTLGVGSRRFDTKVKENVTDYSYQILASLLLERPLNKEIKENLGVDFRLTPYINTLNKPVTKITLSRSWFEKWRTSFSRTIEDAQSDVRFKYDLNKQVSLTAFWENTGQVELEQESEDRLGLDFEFNFDF